MKTAPAVRGGIGMLLLQRMGWKQGEGLGRNKEGSTNPLLLDVKMDRRGLQAQEETPCKVPQVKMPKDLSHKHPVSALTELCTRRKWGAPHFIVVHESGPDHKKNFLFKVTVNGVDYQPSVASANKKHARAQAATVCLQALSLLPKDSPFAV